MWGQLSQTVSIWALGCVEGRGGLEAWRHWRPGGLGAWMSGGLGGLGALDA